MIKDTYDLVMSAIRFQEKRTQNIDGRPEGNWHKPGKKEGSKPKPVATHEGVIFQQVSVEDYKLLAIEELQEAVEKIKTRKVPGSDGVHSEVIKTVGTQYPELTLRVINSILKEGVFPEEWKRAMVRLISRPGKAGICLLDVND
ncbi:hypothetical protein ILUMI_05422 [Ignelater luminosus]|uniref:Reverse transcriptase n=1 Tax=Ignelater luminosus TaxID=2038154 RepID=A0A8K0DAJ3_IGNLU|nr:hypothetical protein ILUMI_05422 [Ignelater luminosus]